MTNTEGTVAKRRVDVAFPQCFDATVFAEPVMMTDAEEQRLRPLLALLPDFGLILQPNVAGRRRLLRPVRRRHIDLRPPTTGRAVPGLGRGQNGGIA
jgi:hypothetical protein